MSEDSSSSSTKSWVSRLGQILSGGEPQDREDLMEILEDAHKRGLIDADMLQMLEGSLEVDEMRVRDIMVPRGQMVVIEQEWTLSEILQVIARSGHSRFPVIGESKDEVVGILLAKDLLRYCSNAADFSLSAILRPANLIPESKRLNVLLKEFRSNRNHMAVVMDEFGGVSGLVTIEDVLEQIVGEIDDEHDSEEEANIRQHTDERFTVKALTPIEEFNEFFGSEFSDEEFDTIGGLVVNAIGHLPKRGEEVDIGRFRFSVLGADNRRLYLLKVALLAVEEPGEDE